MKLDNNVKSCVSEGSNFWAEQVSPVPPIISLAEFDYQYRHDEDLN